MNNVDFEKEEETREFQYVYFIENHIETTHVFIGLSKKQIAADNLECLYIDNKEIGSKDIYIYSIYRFRLYSFRIKEKDFKLTEDISKHSDIQVGQKEIKSYDITIELKDEDKNDKFEKAITIKDFEKDIFIFDFKFDKQNGWIFNKDPPKSYYFSLEEQFHIYIDFLRNRYKKLKQKSRQNYGLILSIQKILEEKNKKFNFTFFLIILLECFATPLVQRHLDCFKPSKIESVGIISEGKLRQVINILNVFEKNPEKILSHIENENSKKIYEIKLFSIILYFNFYFNKNKIPELLLDKKDPIFIYKAFIEFNELFDFLKLDLQQIQLLINNIQDFNQLCIALTYSKNVQELLSVILLNFEKIFQLYYNKKEEYKKKTKYDQSIKKPIINISEFASPDRKDCMQKIYDLYCSLIMIEKNYTKENFIYFSSSLFEKYINYFNSVNIDNLIIIKKMISFSKNNSININLNIDINKIIHENGILFSSIGKLKNNDLLDFITLKDDYYILSEYKKFRSLEILDGLDISSFDDNFYEKWKKINWNEIFKEQKVLFYEKILACIIDLNEFKILYKLFDLKHNFVIELLQKKIIELFENYNPKKHTNFIEDIIILLYHSDKKNVKIEYFLNNIIQKYFNIGLVNKIYINLLSKYGDDISQKTKAIISKFFTETPDNMNPEILLILIYKFQNFTKIIFQSLEKYYIKKEDFLEFEDTNEYKLFKGLLDNNFLEKKEFINTYYFQNAKDITNKLIKDIERGELTFSEISIFYIKRPEDKLEKKLLERMTILNLNSKEKGEKLKKIIDNYYSSINYTISDLQVILEDLLDFYLYKESKNIKEIKTIINELKEGKLNCLDQNFKERCSFYISTYKEKTKERAIRKKSKFFWTIYNKNKEKYKLSEDICVNETIKEFDKLKDIFINGLKSLEKNVLQDCFITIKKRNEEEIDEEIETLIKIFQIKDFNNKYEIRKSMIILSKKDDIYNISIAILLFLEKLQIKGNLSGKLKEIIHNIEKSNDENVILNAIKDLKSYSIDIDILYDKNNKEDNYLNIFLLLKKQPEAIIFLTKINYDMCRNLEEIDKLEISIKKSIFICKNSIFLLTNIKDKFFEGMYYEEEEINNQKKKRETEITIDNLLELGERVRLINKKVSGDDQKNKRFIEIVNEIYNIYGLIQDIYKAGYPEIINIKITIINYESQFSGCGLESKTFLRFFSKLKEILTEIRKNIIKSYLDFPVMRFIYGRLFNLIYNSYTKEKKVYNKISSFLKFMSNDLIKEENINFSYKKTGNIYEDLIDNSTNYIEQIMRMNNLNINDIMKQNLISQNKKDIEFKGIYIYKCEELEKELFQLNKYLTNQFIAAQAILLCNKETTTEELTAFLYRAMLCDFNSCFIIASVELLEFDKKSKLIDLLNYTFYELKQKSCLIIAYTNSENDDIIKILKSLKYKKILDIKKKI